MINIQKIKYISISLSLIIFILLNFFLRPSTIFGLDQIVLKITNYFFGVTIDSYDYLIISLIPIISLSYLKNDKVTLKNLLLENLKIIACSIITFCFGLALMIWVGKPDNPLIPQYLLLEPFKIYSTIFISIGIIIPLINNRMNIQTTEH